MVTPNVSTRALRDQKSSFNPNWICGIVPLIGLLTEAICPNVGSGAAAHDGRQGSATSLLTERGSLGSRNWAD